MVFTLNYPKYLVISILLILLNLVNWPGQIYYLVFGGLFLIINSLVLGHFLFIKNSWACKFVYGLLFLTVIASLIGVVAFYFWFLNHWVFIASLLLIPACLLFIVRKYPLVFELDFRLKSFDLRLLILTSGYFLFWLILIYLLYSFRTSASLRTPWEVLPGQFFLIYFLATFILLAIARFMKSAFSLFLIVAHTFLTLSAAWLVYQVGFDYDPFIHRTNLDLILQNGTLLPKPFYYMGQYSLIIFLHNLLRLPLALLDKILVPLAAALYLPTTVYYAFRDNFKANPKYLILAVLACLALPLSGFIVTTPQALSNLIFFITVILSLYYITHPKASAWPLALLSLMVLATHPLSGIPLIFFFLILLVYQHWKKKFNLPRFLHQSILWEVVVLGALALPTAFLINSFTLSQLKVSLQADWFKNIISSFNFFNLEIYYRQFVSLTDLIYTYGNNQAWLIVILAAFGIWFMARNKQLKRYFVYLLSLLMLVVNYLLLKGMISFFSLVAYEQLTYPKRVLELAFYLLMPFVVIALYLFFKKVLQQKQLTQLLAISLISLAISLNFYLAYPRVDKVAEDHGYSTSQTDIETVNFIEGLQKGEPYVVLSSQPVSAAAIRELGFKDYYNDFFFYPVPTGGKLYSLYEELAYARQSIDDVIATVRYLTGVNVVYFVVNDYWYDADRLIDSHKDSSDKWFAIDGRNYIFKYWN